MNLNWNPLKKQTPLSTKYHDVTQCLQISSAIQALLPKSLAVPIVIVCIGTDRSTGDALGPLVGMHLKKYLPEHAAVYGTLEQPIHAVNLNETLSEINHHFNSPFIIAVDACLGKLINVGKICVSEGPVLPGSGVNKKLMPVGDMNITGIVNISGFMEYSVLQNTRLNVVMNLSLAISRSILMALRADRYQTSRSLSSLDSTSLA